MYAIKTYEELTFVDDFVFCKVLTNHPDLCRELLELAIGCKVGAFVRLDKQEPIEITSDGRGIRFDVYAEDDNQTVYDCEMQTTTNQNLSKRTRYYQGMIDLNLIERGQDYCELKKSYIIFICPFDAFGRGLHKYTFEHRCLEDVSLGLGDEATVIFLCADGDADDISEDMKDFLNYVSGKEGAGRLVRGLDDAVKKVRNHEEWRLEYMTLQMRDQEMMKKGREEGREEGRNLQLWKMIQKKIVKGKSLEQIADELEEREEDIRLLYEQVKEEQFETMNFAVDANTENFTLGE